MVKNEVLVGHVGVDSGTVAICDPAYAEYLTMDSVIEALEHSEDLPAPIGSATTDLGIVAPTGIGDGWFPVYAEYEDSAIVALRIEFKRPEPEGADIAQPLELNRERGTFQLSDQLEQPPQRPPH